MGVTYIPAPTALDPIGAGFGQGFSQGIGQSFQNQRMNDDIQKWLEYYRQQQLAPQTQLAPGQQGPQFQAQMPQMRSPMGQQMMMQGVMGQAFRDPQSSTQQLNQWRLNQLQGMTPEEQKQYMLKPPISITMPTGQALLPPAKRKEIAEAEYEEKLTTKPLTPTEQKGVQATIKNIMGEGKSLPFGAKPGPALKQGDMEKKWENTIEATGYAGRSKVQQKQIENEFDRYVGMLNQGKGLGVLANQYQWSRGKYKNASKIKLSDVPIPSDKREFINKLRELEGIDPKLSAEYYRKYLDKFW